MAGILSHRFYNAKINFSFVGGRPSKRPECFPFEFISRDVPYMVHLGAPVKKPNRRKAVPSSGSEDPNKRGKRVPAIFFRTEAGREPVRDWLKTLPYPGDRKRIGEDIKTVEFGWSVGMPVCRPLGQGIYEVRTDHVQPDCPRFVLHRSQGRMVLL